MTDSAAISADLLNDRVTALVELFRYIYAERMRGVSILNLALDVEAVGFQTWEDRLVGVLVTPWFMGLMLLPGEHDDWSGLSVTQKVLHTFPSGRYEFTVGMEPGFGIYQSCSLCSPVLQFPGQESARAKAKAVMQALFEPRAGKEGLRQPMSRREWLSSVFLRRRIGHVTERD